MHTTFVLKHDRGVSFGRKVIGDRITILGCFEKKEIGKGKNHLWWRKRIKKRVQENVLGKISQRALVGVSLRKVNARGIRRPEGKNGAFFLEKFQWTKLKFDTLSCLLSDCDFATLL